MHLGAWDDNLSTASVTSGAPGEPQQRAARELGSAVRDFVQSIEAGFAQRVEDEFAALEAGFDLEGGDEEESDGGSEVSPLEASGLACRAGQRLTHPDEGTVVCLMNALGAPLMATRNRRTKAWDLLPTLQKQDGPLLHLPVECLFYTVRRGGFVGLASFAAQGRMVQATKHAAEPLRAANYNFGKWESWVERDGALFNAAWKGRTLGCEIHEVRCCLLSSMYEQQIAHRQEVRELGDTLALAEGERVAAEEQAARIVKESRMHFAALKGAVSKAEGEAMVLQSELNMRSSQVTDLLSNVESLEKTLARVNHEKALLQARSTELEENVKLAQASLEKYRAEAARAMAQKTLEHQQTVTFLQDEHETKVQELQAELATREDALHSIAERVSVFSSPGASPSVKSVTSTRVPSPSVSGLPSNEPAPAAMAAEPEAEVAPFNAEPEEEADKENIPENPQWAPAQQPLLLGEEEADAYAEPRQEVDEACWEEVDLQEGDLQASTEDHPSFHGAEGEMGFMHYASGAPSEELQETEEAPLPSAVAGTPPHQVMSPVAPEDMQPPRSHEILLKSNEGLEVEYSPSAKGKAASSATLAKIDDFFVSTKTAGGRRVGGAQWNGRGYV